MAEVVTGEAVVIELPCARFPTRAVAPAIDLLIQVTALILLSGVAVAAAAGGALNPAAVTALGLLVFVLIVVGYPATIETLSGWNKLELMYTVVITRPHTVVASKSSSAETTSLNLLFSTCLRRE